MTSSPARRTATSSPERWTECESITLDDVQAFYDTHYTRDNVVPGIGGGYDEELRRPPGRLISRTLPAGAPADQFPLPQPLPIEGFRVTIVEKDAPATAISMGFPIDVLRGSARVVCPGDRELLAGRAPQFQQPSVSGDPRGARTELRRLLVHRALSRAVACGRCRRRTLPGGSRSSRSGSGRCRWRTGTLRLRAALREFKHAGGSRADARSSLQLTRTFPEEVRAALCADDDGAAGLRAGRPVLRHSRGAISSGSGR